MINHKIVNYKEAVEDYRKLGVNIRPLEEVFYDCLEKPFKFFKKLSDPVLISEAKKKAQNQTKNG